MCTTILKKTWLFQLENVHQVPLHDRTLGIWNEFIGDAYVCVYNAIIRSVTLWKGATFAKHRFQILIQ